MTWLTWRQFRIQAIAASAALAALAVILAITGPNVSHLFAASGVAACQAHGDCQNLAVSFFRDLRGSVNEILFFVGVIVVYGAPAVIGMFWGAPLVTREVEGGTLRLAWNQSVTRTRWLAVKLALIGLAAMAAAGLASLMVTWWESPIMRAALQAGPDPSISINRLDPALFGAHGIVPVGYAAFAFALGVTAGVLLRRTVPAMAVTLVVFALVQLAVPLWIRPHLITPVRQAAPLNVAHLAMLDTSGNGTQITVLEAVNKPAAWIVSNETVTPAGHVYAGPAPQACTAATQGPQDCANAIGRLHLRQVLIYQPGSRYWALQWEETAIFLVVAAALAGFCFWQLRRGRLS